MSDYPMLISNKLHSFRNFQLQLYICKLQIYKFNAQIYIRNLQINIFIRFEKVFY